MIVDDLVAALDRQDAAAYGDALQALTAAIPDQAPEEVAGTAARLAPVLARLPWGIGSHLAPVLGGMCDHGADPAAVLPVLVDCAVEVLAQATRFKELMIGLGLELPEPGDGSAFPAAVQALLASSRSGLAEPEAAGITEAWFTAEGWIRPVLYLAQRKQVRVAMPRRAELAAAIEAAREDLGIAQWLHGLLLVLDDEPFLILHRATGQGWRCTTSGIGDNFQLHTLLAGRLAGFIAVEPPNAVELAAADSGPPQPPGGIRGNFNLVDAYGEWIWNEGRPVDVPHFEGVRVIVIDPAPYPRSWSTGRIYPMMAPDVTVECQISAEEAASWLAKVKPDARARGAAET